MKSTVKPLLKWYVVNKKCRYILYSEYCKIQDKEYGLLSSWRGPKIFMAPGPRKSKSGPGYIGKLIISKLVFQAYAPYFLTLLRIEYMEAHLLADDRVIKVILSG